MNDEELERMMRRADPAASLPPLTEFRFDRLKEAAMSEQTITPAPKSRKPLIWGVVGGLAAVGAAAAIVVSMGLGQPSGPTVALTSPGGGDPMATSLKCMETTPELVATGTLAFAGTVSSIEGDTVTLDVTEQFAGEPVGAVTTQQGSPEISDGASPVYEVGEKWLVTSDGENIFSCGLSAQETPELRAIYGEAFGK